MEPTNYVHASFFARRTRKRTQPAAAYDTEGRPVGATKGSEAPYDMGRQTPAAKAYSNDRRAGRTHPGKIEQRDAMPQPRRARRSTGKPNRMQRRSSHVGRPISTSPRKAPGLHPLSRQVLVVRGEARRLRAGIFGDGTTSITWRRAMQGDLDKAAALDELADSWLVKQPAR